MGAGMAGGLTRLTGYYRLTSHSGEALTCATAGTTGGSFCAESHIETNGNLDVAGTSTLTGAATITGALNGAILQTDEVSITLAEMTDLVANNKTLVAARGADAIIIPVQVLFFLDYGSAAFTESADNLVLNYGGASGDAACSLFETTGSWLVQTADSYGFYTCDTDITVAAASIKNKAITLDNNNADFGGGTGSTVTVWITYYVIDVS
jgi:hypothetical protein